MARPTSREGGDDPHQLQIDWTATPAVAAPSPPPPRPRPSQASPCDQPAPPPLVQRLPWDFQTSFPQPTDEAVENGLLDESDREPENLKSLHDNYARQCLATMAALDTVLDARRKGVDPGTGRNPRSHASRVRLDKYLAEEPARLEHAFEVLIGTYEEAFGSEAADAFRKAIIARHAGIEVAVEYHVDSPSGPGKPKARGISSCLPVPRPLRASVEAGVFGYDEAGKPIRPSAEEVRALTEQHAEKLVEHMASAPPTGASASPAARHSREIQNALSQYAEDFGLRAAQQLEAYARRQARLLHPSVPSRQR